jgi:phosphatidylglycerol:prolipoprotein diacylglycerol transferase
MIPYPRINPVIFSIGPLHVRWYGLMYVLGFIASCILVRKQIDDISFKQLDEHFENLNVVLIICVVLGGRLGYVLFYNLPYYMANPWQIPATWHGGMSFHGACIGLILGSVIFCRRHKIDFWTTADIYVVTVPIGLGLGRIGNFINGELFGRVTNVPWAMVFPDGGPLPRHPSQLYEAFLEGVVLFIVLWSLRKRPWQGRPHWPHGSLFAAFLIGYGIFRIFAECFRQPDPQIGFLFHYFTEGQLLSSIMVVGGVFLWWLLVALTRRRKAAT